MAVPSTPFALAWLVGNELNSAFNSSKNSFSIELTNIMSSSIELFDIMGQRVYAMQLQENSNRIEVDGLQLQPGMYLVKVNGKGQEAYTEKMLIIN